jgi:hypothetical protein
MTQRPRKASWLKLSRYTVSPPKTEFEACVKELEYRVDRSLHSEIESNFKRRLAILEYS